MGKIAKKFWDEYWKADDLEKDKIIEKRIYPKIKEIFGIEKEDVGKITFINLFKDYINDAITYSK